MQIESYSKEYEKNMNNKKILCYNMINNKVCHYNNKCMYAHSLSEQKVESIRHKAYTILKSDSDLRTIDLINDEKLFTTLKTLTRVCTLCIKNICPGGYNCRNGAINYKYKICYEDLINGNCSKPNCLSLHLTDRGLIPYNVQKAIHMNNDIFNIKEIQNLKKNTIWENKPASVLINNSTKKEVKEYSTLQKYNNIKKTGYLNKKYIKDNIEGVLLTDKIISLKFGNRLDEISSDSEDDNEIDKIAEYINNDSEHDSRFDESIFEENL